MMERRDGQVQSQSLLSNQKHPMKDVTYGSIAGICSKYFEHPFDLVKVRLQSQPSGLTPLYDGPLDCLRKTVAKEGLRGLYRGVSMPVVGAMAENATLFLVYGQVQRLIRNVVFGDDGRSNATLPLPYVGLSAACAGATASFILTPIELVKCRMQVQEVARVDKSKPLAGPLGIVRSAIRQNGLRALWLGQTGTLLRETGGSAVWFCTFETMVSLFVARRQDQQKLTASSSVQKKLYKSDLSSVELMISGAISGILYNLVFFPADSIKSTIQTASELRPGEPTTNLGFIRTGREIVASRGWKGIYAGCGITCLRGAPSSALIFWIVSRLESRFG